jgi:hypothetical protein
VVANCRVAGVGERECTWGVRTREPDDLVLHLVEREGVTVVDVSENLFVRLLVAGGFGEVKAHESDEGVDVLDSHGLHVSELRSRGFKNKDHTDTRGQRIGGQSSPTLTASKGEQKCELP